MSSFILKFRFVFVLFAFSAILFLQANAEPVRTVLLEQHTGAWCGYCVDGTVIMDQILAKYPTQVIGVKVHNGDGMVIPEQATIASELGLTGYPTGSVDRIPYNGSIFLGRSNWTAAVEAAMNESPKVDISMIYSVDNGVLKGIITAKILADINDDVRFNAYIVEDDVVGSGTGWDQSNYYNTASGHPYYGKGNPVLNYHHMKVVRQMMGGAWGSISRIPIPAKAGSQFTFSFKTTLDSKWNPDKISVVGLVQAFSQNSKRNYNSCMAVKGTVPDFQTACELTSTGSAVGVKPKGQAFEKLFDVKNAGTADQNYQVDMNKFLYTPNDWTTEVTPSTFTLKPGESKQVSCRIIPGNIVGIGDAKVVVTSLTTPALIELGSFMTCYSADIDKIQVIDLAASPYSFRSMLDISYPGQFFDISTSNYSTLYTSFPKQSCVIWNGVDSKAFSTAQVNVMRDLNTKKVNQLITGGRAINSLNSASALSTFGLQFLFYSREGYNQPNQITLAAIPNDPITGEFGNNIPGTLIGYLLPVVRILDEVNVTPILSFAKSKDSVVAVKIQKAGMKSVIIGFCPYVLDNSVTRNKMLKNAIDWMLEPSSAEPVLTESKSISNVYPNPASNQITIDSEHLTGLPYSIYSIFGQKVSSGLYNGNIDIQSLSTGAYTLNIGNEVLKFMKH